MRIKGHVLLAVGLAAGMTVGTVSAVGANSANIVNGDNRANDLEGTGGPDIINGRGGNDDIYGFGGGDRLEGGPGRDDIEGGSGNDRIQGGRGVDDVYGGPGNDRISVVDDHPDDVSCGSGVDRVAANPGDDVARDCEVVVRRGSFQGDRLASPPPIGSPISAQRAGVIAATHVAGVVDDIERDNDDGAYWEVDVYSSRGEYTVYVTATGQVLLVEGPFRD